MIDILIYMIGFLFSLRVSDIFEDKSDISTVAYCIGFCIGGILMALK